MSDIVKLSSGFSREEKKDLVESQLKAFYIKSLDIAGAEADLKVLVR